MDELAKNLGLILIAAPFILFFGYLFLKISQDFVANVFEIIGFLVFILGFIGGVGLLLFGKIIGIFLIFFGILYFANLERIDSISEKWKKKVMSKEL